MISNTILQLELKCTWELHGAETLVAAYLTAHVSCYEHHLLDKHMFALTAHVRSRIAWFVMLRVWMHSIYFKSGKDVKCLYSS